MDQLTAKPKLSEIIRSRYFLVGVFLAVFIWPFDAVIDVYIFGDTITVWQEIFNPGLRDVYMRSLISVSFAAFGFFTSVVIFKNAWAHQQIMLNEEKASLLLNSTGEAIYGIDLNGECTFANQACLDLLGFQSDQELIGKDMHVLIHHTHNDGSPYPVEECKIFQAFQKGEGAHVDDEVLWRADGSSFPAEYRSSPMRLEGKIIGAVVSFADITERKILEHERKQAQETLITAVGDTASVTGADFFTSMVRHLATAFGVKYAFLTECIGKGGGRVRSLAFWHTDHFADTIEYDVDGTPCKRVTMESCSVYYASGIQKLFPEDQDLVDLGVDSYFGVPIFNASKTIIGHVVLLNPTPIDDAYHMKSFLQIFAARAGAELERLQAEHEQERIAAEQTLLIDTSNAPIFGINTKLQINEWNQAAERITGYKRDEVMDCLFIHEFIDDKNKDEVSRIFKDALLGKETASFELNILTRTGVNANVLFNTSTRRDIDGDITGVIGIGQDITELRQKESALNQAQKMEAVGQLTGGIAHDFNNLLSIISGNLRFLQEEIGIGESSIEIDELFEDAMSAADDGAELTQRLLSFSRSRALKPELKNVNETIEKSARFLSRTLAAGVELNIDMPDEDLIINIDPSQLENALLNLSLNARDAMPKGGTITISATRYHHGDGDKYRLALTAGDYIEVSVTDTGTGVKAEDLPHVYEPFFTTKEVGKGSGLGLSMVYGFTQQSNGACHIVSTPGEGTTVSMYFPAVMDNKTIEKQNDEKHEQIQGAEVILVVEDEPRVRRVTLRDLKKLGYKTLEAENADMAKTIIESGENIDLLFSDVLMPGEMDGHKLGVWTEKNYPQIQVVLTSGYSKDKTDVSSEKSYPFPLVRKPYAIDKLAKQIRATLAEES